MTLANEDFALTANVRAAEPVSVDKTAPDASEKIHEVIMTALDDAKAEETITINLAERSPIGDFMVITSGRSNRHVAAIADQILRKLKDAGAGNARVEGLSQADWVLIDTGDVILHIFRPEVRAFYNLEKMWLTGRPNSIDDGI